MEYGMVSTLIPKEYETEFRANSRNTMQDAANALQWNIYSGLCANLGCEIPLFNILPCGNYPQYYKHPFISSFSFGSTGKNLGFCNVKVIRNYFKTVALKRALNKWCRSSSEPKTLFVYTISQPFMSAVSEIKRRYKNVHICAIIADLPDMANLSSKKSLMLNLFSKHKAKESYSLISCVDSFVLLTKHMADYMHITQPFCVMEGIATSTKEFSSPDYDNDNKTIFYAGTLHRKFGVLNLLEAFMQIEAEDYNLVLCGAGDSEDEIREAAKKDSRIKFYGQVSRKEVLELQTKATVLVNPRQNNEEFTRYSFPSKNLEYLSSGIPFIAYKLDGIPDEYDDYILYVNDNDVASLSRKIIDVCEQTSEERELIGIKAKQFVNQMKNEVLQTSKIISLVSDSEESV